MSKSLKTAVLMAASVILGMGMTACQSDLPAINLPETNTVAASATIAASSTPIPTNTHTPSPSPTFTPTSTDTPAPPSPTPVTPTYTPTALACLHQPGRIETGAINVAYLPAPLDFRVYLPPCYDELPQHRYPVLYLLHGQSNTDDQWVRLGVPGASDALISGEELPPFLVVMPRDRVWKQPSEDKFGEALVKDLIPWIDAHFHTLSDRKSRAIGGLSRGAGWAVHLGLRYWQMFGAIGAHSLPIFWEDVSEIKNWIDAIPLDSFPRLYLDIGDHDQPEMLESNFWFEGLLTEKGIPHEWHLFSGQHMEAYWQSHVEQYLRWYAAEW